MFLQIMRFYSMRLQQPLQSYGTAFQCTSCPRLLASLALAKRWVQQLSQSALLVSNLTHEAPFHDLVKSIVAADTRLLITTSACPWYILTTFWLAE